MVYRATQLNVKRDVAIKMIPPEFMQYSDVVQRFEREAKLASQLSHPNTITVHDYGQHDDYLFIVMELLEGEDLADLLNRESTVDPGRIVDIASQVLRSLSEAHKHNIVHRDLKPENIFLTNIGEETDFVKVVDFGIAKLAMPDNTEESGRRLTMDGNTVGTPTYMSPEQAAGGDVDSLTDLYALGVIMFEMACGHPPFDAEDAAKTMRQHIFAEVPEFSKTYLKGSQLEAVVQSALTKEKEDRFQSASDFLHALEDCDPNAPAEKPVIVSPGPPEKLGSSDESTSAADPSASDSIEYEKTAAYQSTDPQRTDNDEDPERRHPPVSAEREHSDATSESSILTVLEPSQEREVIVLDNPKHKPADTGEGSSQMEAVPNGRSASAPAGRGLGNPGSSPEVANTPAPGTPSVNPDDVLDDNVPAESDDEPRADETFADVDSDGSEWSFEGDATTDESVDFQSRSRVGSLIVWLLLLAASGAAVAWYYGFI